MRIRLDPIAFIVRRYDDDDRKKLLVEELGKINGVCVITMIDGDVAYIQGGIGRMGVSDLSDLKKLLGEYGVTKIVWERSSKNGIKKTAVTI